MRRSLAEMAWPEVAKTVADGPTTVILPLGATEQHGPHLPLGTDTFRAAALANRLAATLPHTLVAPTLPIGCSDEHSGFAGLLSLDHETLANLIVDCARRMADWAVCRLVILSAHGGNARALEIAAARLAEELPVLEVVVLGFQMTLSDAILSVADADGIPSEAVGLHAGEGETSEMLSIRPDLVLMERAEAGYCEDAADLMPKLQRAGLRSVTPTGTLGDARSADANRGARYLSVQIQSFLQALADSSAMHLGQPS